MVITFMACEILDYAQTHWLDSAQWVIREGKTKLSSRPILCLVHIQMVQFVSIFLGEW